MKFPHIPVIVVVVFIVGFFTGRMSAPQQSGPSAPAPTAPVAMQQPQQPPMMPPSAAAGESTVTGVVSEVLQVPNYTYLRLATSGGDEWAAVSTTNAVTAGQSITVRVSTRMQNFASKSLNRTFDSIIFGELGGAGAAPGPVDQNAALPPNHPPMGATAPTGAPAPNDTVAKAIDATRQAEPALPMRVVDVFSERQMLQGRQVKVTGTLAKVTDVGGAHYGHLTDGSGSANDKTNDLVVISAQPLPAADSKVSLQGVVVLDKDVGIGAKWVVALDSVSVVK